MKGKPKTQSSYQPPANELPPPSLLTKRYTFRFSATGEDKNALIKAALERAGKEIESGDHNAAFEFIMDRYIQATEPASLPHSVCRVKPCNDGTLTGNPVHDMLERQANDHREPETHS